MKNIFMNTAITSIIALFLCCAQAWSFCFEEAGLLYNISPQLLWSIAKVESDFKPQAINRNKNSSYDYGLMQINSGWYQALGPERWKSLSDPCMNVKVGSWILAQCIKRHGYTWGAVGCYNATSKSKRDIYARKVYSTLVRYTDYGKSRIFTSAANRKGSSSYASKSATRQKGGS